MGMVFDADKRQQDQSRFDLTERDAEHAHASDYVLFFGVSAISVSLMALGLLKLIGGF